MRVRLDQRDTAHLGGDPQSRHVLVSGAVVTDDHPGDRSVTQHVRLGAQAARVVVARELVSPRRLVRRPDTIDRPGRGLFDPGELQQVVRPARLRTGSDRRPFPPAERLPLHDGAGRPAIHVRVADLDTLDPVLDLVGVERVEAARQPEVRVVLDVDRMIQIVGADQPEHRPEALRPVVPAAPRDTEPNPGRPQTSAVVEGHRLDQPLLARLEHGEATLQRSCRGSDHRSHHRRRVGRPPDPPTRHRVAEPASEVGVVVHRCLDDRQTRRRALLAGVPEGGLHQIGDRQVEIGRRRDDHRVLAAGLAEQPQVGPPRPE